MFLQVCTRQKNVKSMPLICNMLIILIGFSKFQGRVIIIWLSWLIGGICGVVILLIIVCYCRLMPRHQKSFGKFFNLKIICVHGPVCFQAILSIKLCQFYRWAVFEGKGYHQRHPCLYQSGWLHEGKECRGKNIYENFYKLGR